jgi:phenylalanyl-tRNA synthetase beta chain
LSEYLGLDDTVFDIGITPNRPDAMNHLGIAREIAAITGKKLKLPRIRFAESKKKTKEFASVRVIDSVACPRYTVRVLLSVNVGPSPKWMQNLLQAVGIRPINNVVDATNYVLMECGHPLHAFDYDKISRHEIIVKCGNQGQPFTTLDHKERKLRGDTLMICDSDGPLAVAGVMGGINSEISEATTNVLLESAYFDPRSVRRTSKYLGISSDASQRFERGADPNATRWAADRAASLMREFCGGEVLCNPIDVYPRRIVPKRVPLRVKKANEILGTTLRASMVSALLHKLGIDDIKSAGKKKVKDELVFLVPTSRQDLEREIDLVEEIARMYGYGNIGIQTRTSLEYSTHAPAPDADDVLREWLIGRGFREIITNSMEHEWMASLASNKAVEVANPISKDMGFLRTSLIPSALSVVRNNVFQGAKNLRLFEIGRVYFRDRRPGKPGWIAGFEEFPKLILVFYGNARPQDWDIKSRFIDIFDVKGELEALFEKIFLDNYKFIPYPTTKALTEDGLLVEINGEEAGFLGNVRKTVLQRFDIESDVYVAELEAGILSRVMHERRAYRAPSRYPLVARDLAIVVDEGLPVEDLVSEIRRASGPLLTSVELFDIYRGNQIGAGKKSCAFSMEYRSEDHTLTQEEIEVIVRNVIGHLSSKFNASLRA